MPDFVRPRLFSTLLLVTVSGALLLGCSSSPGAGAGGAGGSAGAGGGSGGTTGSPDIVVGGFAVQLKAADPTINAPAYTAVAGRVADGPRPNTVIMKVVEEAGGCRLRTPRVPFCNTACGSESVCGDDDKCLPYPKAQNLGLVRVKGLGAGEFSMEPINGNYQPSASVMLPNPPCPEGAPIELQTAGGAYPSFTLKAKGITALAVAGSGAIPLTSDQPLKLQWTAPGDASFSRVLVRVDISHHGGLKGEIECDVPDTGTLEIPGTMVGKLIALGTAGFPTVYLTRASTGYAVIQPGRVTLEVSSSVERPLEIDGIVSCNDTVDCPAGKICQADRTCR
jgi:hypothetical protein